MQPGSNLGIGTLLARNWWTVALRGAIAILFGLALLIWPGIGLRVLVVLFGLFAIVGGAFTAIVMLLIVAYRLRNWHKGEPPTTL